MEKKDTKSTEGITRAKKAKSAKTEPGSTPAAKREVVSAAASGPNGARSEESREGSDPGPGAPGSRKTAGRIKVTLVKSTIGFDRKQAAVVRGLGLRGLHHTVDLLDTPAMRGMIHKVRHLVEVN